YQKALEILTEASEVDSIFVILTPQLVTEIEDTAKLLNTIVKTSKKPTIPVFLGGEYINTAVRRLNNNKILCFTDLNIAIYVLDKITEYSQYLHNKYSESEYKSYLSLKKKNTFKKYADKSLTILPEDEVQSLVKEFQLDIPKTILVDSPQEAVLEMKNFEYPVVIKASTEDVVHKTDVKAIYLDINNDEDLFKKSTKMIKDIQEESKKSHISFLLQEQIAKSTEIFIGIKRDDSFGYSMLFGSGGIYTEV